MKNYDIIKDGLDNHPLTKITIKLLKRYNKPKKLIGNKYCPIHLNKDHKS